MTSEESGFWYSRDRFPDGFDWDGDYPSLSELSLGMVRGSMIDETMQANWGDDIVRSRDVQSLFALLYHGRVDLVAINNAVGEYVVQLNGWEGQLASIPQPIATLPAFFGLSRSSGAVAYADQFDAALTEMREEGRLNLGSSSGD